MQLKLLNFHKLLANLASNLVGAFISLIIYQASHSLMLAFLYLVCTCAVRLICNITLKNLYAKYPQLFLLIRIVPIVLYNISILLLNVNLLVGVIGACIFVGINDSINSCSKEIIYNYSSLENCGNDSLSVTRIFEQIGTILAFVVGGFLLDVSTTLVVIISLVLYIISTIPLFIYYIKSRKSSGFNQDATSNAVVAVSKNPNLSHNRKKLVKAILRDYFIIYFLFAFVDVLITAFNLYLFISGGAFAVAGIFSALYNIAYAIGAFIYGKINEKHDTLIIVIISSIIVGIITTCLPFISNIVCLGIMFFVIGMCLPVLSIFVLERMMIKSRILGISNNALMARENACTTAYTSIYGLGMATALVFPILPIFFLISISMFVSAIAIPKNEETTRQLLVGFLQNDDINIEHKPIKK